MYVTHAKEGLQDLGDKLLELEKSPEDVEIINECFRLSHTIKGMARTMTFEKTGLIAHSMENILDGVRTKRLEPSSSVIDLLFQCVDAMDTMTDAIKEKKPEPEAPDLMKRIEEQMAAIAPEEDEPESKEETVEEKTSEKPTEKKVEKKAEKKKADAIEEKKSEATVKKEPEEKKKLIKVVGFKIKLIQACDMPSARALLVIKRIEKKGRIIDSNPSIDDIEAEKFGRIFSVWAESSEDADILLKDILKMKWIESADIDEKTLSKTERKDGQDIKKSVPDIASVRVKMDRLDDLLDSVGELVINKISLLEMSKTIGSPRMAEALRSLDRLTSELQYNVLRIRMVPIDTVFSRFPRMVRDLARQMGKEVDFVIEGQEIELDRTVIDKLGDLIVHLLRNSIDHGIETTSEREKAGKGKIGTLKLSAAQEQNRVMIRVEDDGRGVDPEKIRKKALEKGLYLEDQLRVMTDQELIDILGKPGFSMAEKVTEISGRGVGLDAVKAGVESLGGQMMIESVKGQGTKIIIRLPLTLAIILAMLVKISNETYAISVDPIVETVSVKDSDIKTIGGMPVIKFREDVVPLIYLSEILGVKEKTASHEVIIIEIGQKRFGFVIDEVLGQQEIVVKPLDKHLRKVQFLGGATILGSGEVALIIDMVGLTNYLKDKIVKEQSRLKSENNNSGG